MNYIQKIVTQEVDRVTIKKILDESLNEDDFYCRKSRHLLSSTGLEIDAVLTLLAHHKSSIRYGYDLSPDSLSQILKLAKIEEKEAPLKRLIESPFFLVKACWLYEHAPYFFFYDEGDSEDRDFLVIEFAEQYESRFLRNRVAIDTWKKIRNPRRVRVTTFWESKIFDPLLLIERAKDDNIEGLELNVDFHPFNYTKLLPEELTNERREQIKEACLRSGIKIDIHSPIVGPYTPSPDPTNGKQRFYDPAQCLEVQYETIELAKDIGAGSVVVHLIDTSSLKRLVALIEKAGGENIFQDVTGHTVVDLEAVLLRDPEVIIACSGHGEAGDRPFGWVKQEARLGVTAARRDNRVYEVDGDLVSRPGPRAVDALEWFAYFIHPELFDKP